MAPSPPGLTADADVLAYDAGTIRYRVGLRTWFAALPLAVDGAPAGSYLVPLLALPALFGVRGVADVTRTRAGQNVNDRIGRAGPATVLSAMAMVSGLAVVPVQLAAGAVADLASPLLALPAGGLLLAVGAATMLLLSEPIATLRGGPA